MKDKLKIITGGNFGGNFGGNTGANTSGKTNKNEGADAFNKYVFKRGICTTTRLIGVVGVCVYWEDIKGNEVVQFYHLDFEEYGIDVFEEYCNIDEENVHKIQSRIMGGLGGNTVEITEREIIMLLKMCYQVNLKYEEYIPDDITSILHLIKAEIEFDGKEYDLLYKQIFCEILSEEHLINYYIMRQVAVDYEIGRRLMVDGQEASCLFTPTDDPSTLIKNNIECIGENKAYKEYRVKSLIDYGSRYKHIVSNFKISVDELKVMSCFIEDFITISNIEAAFQLKKEEYIGIYHVNDIEFFEDVLVSSKPDLMCNSHEHGNLYTEFYKHNKHVNKAIYYLNGDVELIYYVTSGNQLVVSSFCEKNLKLAMALFSEQKYVSLISYVDDLRVDISVLYDFVNSSYTDFFMFIDDGEDRRE